MKKVLFSMLMVLFFSAFVYAGDTKGSGFYIGIGGSYALENMDNDDLDTGDIDFDDTQGANIKVGYHFNNMFSVELDVNYLPEFEGDADYDAYDIYNMGFDLLDNIETDVTTCMLSAKFSPKLGSSSLRLLILGGVGIMNMDGDYKEPSQISHWYDEYGYIDNVTVDEWDSCSFSETGACAKIGLGLEYFMTEHVSAGLESSYVVGFGDVDGIDYTNFTFSVAYHF